jgi:aminopeptidase N
MSHRSLTIPILLTLFLLSAPRLAAQSVQYPTVRTYAQPGTEPPEHPLDMLHMRLEVRFDPLKKLVVGKVTHVFTPLRERVDSVFFNGPGIRIREATLNGARVRTRTSPEGITVYPTTPWHWDSRDSITFVYEAQPRRGMYFVGWDDPEGKSRKQIWTQGQGIDNRHWFPCYDEQNDKLTTETVVTFDSAYRVLSNGTLQSTQDNGDGTTTWHYRMTHPHASYLVMIGIGTYAVKTVFTRAGVPVHLWYYPDEPDRVEPTYRYAAECIDFVAEHTGVPYPWESYANIPVQDFLYGAMENTTATVFGDFLLVDARGFFERNYIAVDVHELTHQWFGDFVTGRSGKSSWLHESFATFYPKLFLKTVYGEEWYEWERREEQNAALTASVANRVPIIHGAAGSARVYQKGSAILDMMMYTFGEEAYRRVIHRYLLQHAYGNVETNDLYQAYQDVLGVTPDWFFDEWIYRGGEPRYGVTCDEIPGSGTADAHTVVTVRQIHERDELVGLFRMPIVFEAHFTDGTSSRVIETIQAETERVVIPTPRSKRLAFVLFDPGGYILKSVTFDKPFAMLQAQAASAPLMIDRYDAVRAMRAMPFSLKRDDLMRAFAREKFHAIKSEVVAQLAGDPDPRSRDLLRKAAEDADAPVRASVVRSLDAIPAALLPACESLLRDSAYTTVALALEKLCAQYPENAPRYLALTKDDRGIGNQLKILWHELNARRGVASSIDSLTAYCSVSNEFRTRINALEALQRLNACTDALIPHLFSALTHFNARLRAPAGTVCAYFLQQTAPRERLMRYYHAHAWPVADAEFLEPLFGKASGQ